MSVMTVAPAGARPPAEYLGQRIDFTFYIQYRDARHRDSEEVSDIVGRWVVRHVRRNWTEYQVEGWSTAIYPGRTYLDWWFGSVEVSVVRR